MLRTSEPSLTFQIEIWPLRDGSPPPVASSDPSGLKSKLRTRSTSVSGSSTLPIVPFNIHSGDAFQRVNLPLPPASRASHDQVCVVDKDGGQERCRCAVPRIEWEERLGIVHKHLPAIVRQ